MGKVNGYSMICSLVHVTHTRRRKRGRGMVYHPRGGVAILCKDRLTKFLSQGIETLGHNVEALRSDKSTYFKF